MQDLINTLNKIVEFKYTTAIMIIWFILVLVLGYLWGFKRGLIANIINVGIIFVALVVAAIISVLVKPSISNALIKADESGMLKDSGLVNTLVGYLALFIHLICLILFMVASGILGLFRKKVKRSTMRPFYGLISMAGAVPLAAISTAVITPVTKYDNGMSKFVGALSLGVTFSTANSAEGVVEALVKFQENINKINSDNPKEREEGAKNLLNDPSIGNLLDKLIEENSKKEPNKTQSSTNVDKNQPSQPNTPNEPEQPSQPNQPEPQPSNPNDNTIIDNKILEELIGDNKEFFEELKTNNQIAENINKFVEIDVNEITKEQIQEITSELVQNARKHFGESKQIDAILSVVEKEGIEALSNNGVKIVDLGITLVKNQIGENTNIKFDEIGAKLKDIINKAAELKNVNN
ncbi:hypothetical protein HUN03_00494 [Mycoplasmopsis anatis]|uniref:Colicin V production protein n=1 Tax=Mycoplasmopsis anatis TaxID=171279 RepID=A0A9Q3LAN9_9BACT|nr:hypothetical protein [Mycoplasmopsis anatis]MBW0594713.1 hypothetical protein [Mycoplasmopsis anatis]MBW0595578.1 hypothetical protein [Mycoplasmopsis anatis]MBW0596355.1 hypothetical protein [Mycoplasmopsis anatis]MBW0597078.1 hypothetical protein [Mycoplasmopsis anatis]MBW0597832.1 hypothetical protein [Mycoplasmopsis anatis]